MCFYNDGDYPAFHSDSFPHARKVHCCSGCKRPILRGDIYHRHAAQWDGSVSTWATCLSCDRFIELIHRHELREGCASEESWCPVDELKEYARNMTGNGSLIAFGESWED